MQFLSLLLQKKANEREFQQILGVLSFFNPLNANPTKWSNALKQFVGKNQRIVRVCLTILWGWHLKVQSSK